MYGSFATIFNVQYIYPKIVNFRKSFIIYIDRGSVRKPNLYIIILLNLFIIEFWLSQENSGGYD